MKIALLSNVTVEVLARELGERNRVWTAPGFGGWLETALSPPGDLVAFAPDLIAILLDRRFEDARPWTDAEVSAAVASLSAAFPSAAVIVPDVAAIAAETGDGFHDERMWRLGAMPWSVDGLHALAKLFVPHKVLALDLDGTLWEGVLAEDGPDGIRPREDFLAEVKALQARGILLAVFSRNDAGILEKLWESGRLPLGKDDFAALAVDWRSKGENLKAVAAELNLPPEAFVFVDDNPAERAEMRSVVPEVAVAPFPPDLAGWFPAFAVTGEDLVRTRLYREEALRRESAAGLSLGDHLASLKIVTDIRPLDEADLPRVSQLSLKTNQFNVSGNRYSEADLRRLMTAGDRLFLTMRSSDRFGDLGLIAYAALRFAGETAEVTDFTMSCRAMNRQIELVLGRALVDAAGEHGAVSITAVWRASGRNTPSRDLFDRLGYRLVSETRAERRYRLAEIPAVG